MGDQWRHHRPVYRVRQFWRALRATFRPLSVGEVTEARAHLPQPAWSLFDSMGRSDQRHSLNVLHALLASGESAAPLLQAALLHDCAKHGGGVRLWHRVAVVLLRAFAYGVLVAWTAAPPPACGRGSWRYPFWAHTHHPQRGAELAAAAGCDEQAVYLIAHHQDRGPIVGYPDVDRWLRALQAADDDN